jgi:hypothetical protein
VDEDETLGLDLALAHIAALQDQYERNSDGTHANFMFSALEASLVPVVASRLPLLLPGVVQQWTEPCVVMHFDASFPMPSQTQSQTQTQTQTQTKLQDLEDRFSFKASGLRPGVKVVALNAQDHADVVNDAWLYKSDTSIGLVRSMLEQTGPGAPGANGVGVSVDGVLVAWILVYPYGTYLWYTIRVEYGYIATLQCTVLQCTRQRYATL